MKTLIIPQEKQIKFRNLIERFARHGWEVVIR